MKKAIIVFVICFVLFFVIMHIINQGLEEHSAPASKTSTVPVPRPKENDTVKEHDKVIRKVRWEPNRRYEQSIFFADGQEIARYKNIDEKVFDVEGDIPKGEVKFIRTSKGTYGYEHYSDGRRHGPYVEYYENGQIAREADYYQGKRISVKVYYYDGTLRMEENVFDALMLCDDPEAGQGKTYYRDGTLMYEWALTNELKGGYKRSYDVEGNLTEEKIYDDQCQVIKVNRPK
jgi:antitoxin component YwqK of YwqJK toxin-antitoxin module